MFKDSLFHNELFLKTVYKVINMVRTYSMGIFKSFACTLMMLFAASMSVKVMATDKAIEANLEAKVASKILKQEREITISLPSDYDESNHNYPVMYLLDGDSHIDHTASSSRYLHSIDAAPGIIVVGIKNIDRVYDLTPYKDEKVQFETGGGDKFLDFIEKELKPYINKHYRTVDYSIFTGHSLGGMMAVYALINRPEAFDAYFAFSPSLWLKKDKLMALASKSFKNKPNINKYLYINLGNEQGGMLPAFDAFEKILTEQAPQSLRYKLERYPNESHMSIPLIGQVSAYRDLYAKWEVSRDMFELNAKEVIAFYKALSESFGYEIIPNQNGVNDIGYYHLNNKKDVESAIALFKLNAKNYPNSANVYDSLADAYQQQNQLEKALKMVEKAISMSQQTDSSYQYFLKHKEKIEALISEG